MEDDRLTDRREALKCMAWAGTGALWAHTINLFVSPDGKETMPASVQIDGYSIRRWAANGLAYYAVSDIAPADLASFEQSFTATP